MSRKIVMQEALPLGSLDTIEFDFTSSFAEGSPYGVASASTTFTVARGVDPAPSALEAAPALVLNQSVFAYVQGGVRNVTYLVECFATTDEPVPRVLAAACYLPVVKLGQS